MKFQIKSNWSIGDIKSYYECLPEENKHALNNIINKKKLSDKQKQTLKFVVENYKRANHWNSSLQSINSLMKRNLVKSSGMDGFGRPLEICATATGYLYYVVLQL